MNIHKNARLTLRRREELVKRREAGEPLKRLARGFEISVRTARKWWGRYRAEGVAGLADRSSRPHDSPARTAAPLQLAAKVLRWQHWTGAQIGIALGISAATATRILRRGGLNRRGRLELPPVVERYEHAAVGDLLHLDTKKLGRITYLGHRATGQRRGQRHGSGGGRSSTSPWTITRAWPMSSSCLTNTATRPAGSCGVPSGGSASGACGSGACSRITARAIGPGAFGPRAARCGWPITGRGPTPRGRTARPSASSKPCCASGRMPGRTTPPPIARGSCRVGWSTTIPPGRMRVSLGSLP